MRVGGELHASAALPPGKRLGIHCIGGWVGPRPGLDGCEKSRPPTGIRSPDRPACSEPLYRPSCPGPQGTVSAFCCAFSRGTCHVPEMRREGDDVM
jgi:hypothetical protein